MNGLDDEFDVSDLSLLVSEPDAEPLVAPIAEEKLLLEQQKDSFY